MLVKDMIAKADPHTRLITVGSAAGSHTFGVHEDLPEYILDLVVIAHEYFVFKTDPLEYILWMFAREENRRQMK